MKANRQRREPGRGVRRGPGTGRTDHQARTGHNSARVSPEDPLIDA
jgi:hypothetical protein